MSGAPSGRGAMPRYTVHVRGEWLAVPCRDAQLTIGWLGREAVRRYIKNKPDNGGFASVDDVSFLVRRCKGLGLLDHEDPLEVALEDNEFVEVGEWPSPHMPGKEARRPPPPRGRCGQRRVHTRLERGEASHPPCYSKATDPETSCLP